jgi:hypothetical protein
MKVCTGLLMLFVVVLLSGAGCRTAPLAPDVTSQARSGYGLLARKPQVKRTADGLFVSGSVSRGAYYSGSARMHLDLQVFSESGQRLALVPTTFIPNPIPHSPRIPRHACYAQRVRGDFPSGVRVVVEPHPVSLRECANRPGEHL